MELISLFGFNVALEMDPNLNQGGHFAFGSGHLNPEKAKDPGLVYETGCEYYIKYWCKEAGRSFSRCPETLAHRQINYPSMAAHVEPDKPFSIYFDRRVTNVGSIDTTYVAKVTGESDLQVVVNPDSLHFTNINESQDFTVSVFREGIKAPKDSANVYLVWTDGTHFAGSPISIYTMIAPPSGHDKKSYVALKFFIFVFLVIFAILFIRRFVRHRYEEGYEEDDRDL